jgi:D-sedoheptulose 7-phosphate isomerase
MSFVAQFLSEAKTIIDQLDQARIEKMVDVIVDTRARGGRLFMLGVGGSAGNASHAVNDFRKLAGIESYAPTDNVSELTARTNDEGWETVFEGWLKVSRLNKNDTLFIFSVGGGSLERNVSPNLVKAIQLAKTVGASVIGIVGKPDGFAAQVGDAVVVIPQVNPDHITPHSEAFQAVVWHLIITHPRVKANATKWEGITAKR